MRGTDNMKGQEIMNRLLGLNTGQSQGQSDHWQCLVSGFKRRCCWHSLKTSARFFPLSLKSRIQVPKALGTKHVFDAPC